MTEKTASLERRLQPFGMGCLLHVLGLVLAVASLSLVIAIGAAALVVPIAILFGFGVVGYRRSVRYECGNCRTRVAGRNVRVCPVCEARLR